ncbi:hypothetical protein [Streptomyces acidicola]|uniref:hypothetical protein n=1 Tax=Streptomyces acidicola TaxID=2596892 RepID=UPI0034406507
MSRVEWQWRDSGSGPGHMQRVIVHEPLNAVQEAFRQWLTHAAGCRVCRVDEARCERGQRLQAAYREARRGSAPIS